jgi:hypothetical protein
MASLLLRDNVLDIDTIAVLQKIYTLRRRYLGLITHNIDGKSYFPSALSCVFTHGSTSGKNAPSYHNQRENKDLEKHWKELRLTLRHNTKHNLLHFLEHLFALVPYESMAAERARFYRHYPRKTTQTLAHTLTRLAKDVLQD